MFPILTDILTSTWLIHDERKEAYAALLLSLLKGERISEEGFEKARERNRSYVTSKSLVGHLSLSDANIPEGSIAVIPIRGEIMKYDQFCGPRGSLSITQEIKNADANPKIKSILLVVDSPGGQIDYTDILADTIKNSKTPIIAYIEGMAASAAYWIVSGASKIIASSDIDRIGSIGTMLFFADLQPYYEKQGVKFHEIYATKSTDKNKDVRDVLEGKYDNYRKGVLDRFNEKFHSSVKENRPGLDESTLTGKMFFAPEAITMGLIDEIGSMEYALQQTDIEVEVTDPEEANKEKSKNSDNMKITQKFAAIWNRLFGADEKAEEKEVTPEMMQQLNDQLSTLETSVKELTTAKEKAEKDLLTTKTELEALTQKYEKLKAEDAGGETTAKKDKDKISSESGEAVYAHDRIADQYLGK
jgi:protease-4